MKKYKIEAGTICTTYEGRTEKEALEAYAKDAGYATYAALVEQHGVIDSIEEMNNCAPEEVRYDEITTEKLKDFMEPRSALSVSAFCREAGISKRYLDYIISGERPLTVETAEKLLPVMEKYGYKKS